MSGRRGALAVATNIRCLLEYAKSGAVPIYGLNYKDKREDALAWLGDLGDPYVLSAVDLDGRVAIDYGVYGAPETYLIDQNGTIRFKQVGPVTRDVWSDKVLAAGPGIESPGNIQMSRSAFACQCCCSVCLLPVRIAQDAADRPVTIPR